MEMKLYVKFSNEYYEYGFIWGINFRNEIDGDLIIFTLKQPTRKISETMNKLIANRHYEDVIVDWKSVIIDA